jgi:ASC-1-like (ASCH) protein
VFNIISIAVHFSKDLRLSMRFKTLWIKEPYLDAILNGRKVVEVRVGYSNIERLQPGDHLLLNEQYAYRILDVRRYPSFEALLENESTAAIATDLSKEELLSTLRHLYPPQKEALGVIALQIEPV